MDNKVYFENGKEIKDKINNYLDDLMKYEIHNDTLFKNRLLKIDCYSVYFNYKLVVMELVNKYKKVLKSNCFGYSDLNNIFGHLKHDVYIKKIVYLNRLYITYIKYALKDCYQYDVLCDYFKKEYMKMLYLFKKCQYFYDIIQLFFMVVDNVNIKRKKLLDGYRNMVMIRVVSLFSGYSGLNSYNNVRDKLYVLYEKEMGKIDDIIYNSRFGMDIYVEKEFGVMRKEIERVFYNYFVFILSKDNRIKCLENDAIRYVGCEGKFDLLDKCALLREMYKEDEFIRCEAEIRNDINKYMFFEKGNNLLVRIRNRISNFRRK